MAPYRHNPITMPSSPPLLPGADPSCPFCVIAAAYPPAAPTATFNLGPPTPATTTATHPPSHSAANHPLAPEKTSPPSFVLLSTPDVIAFLDIAPLTRGHVLIATRRHRVKTVDLSTAEGAEVRLFCFSLLVPHLAFWEFHISCSKSTVPRFWENLLWHA